VFVVIAGDLDVDHLRDNGRQQSQRPVGPVLQELFEK